jgi:putative SOS response-associated peptidase YedK
MCGRFVQMSPPEVYAGLFGAEPLQHLTPRYNIAPSQPVLAVRSGSAGVAELVLLRWGLVPHWSKGPDNRFSMINARAETVHEKPAYRGPFRYRRCLIPAEGFYEWKPSADGKQPYFIHGANQAPFAMAGLWDHWQDAAGNELESCSIIVTDADPALASIHDRMPLILAPEQYHAWLDPANQDGTALRELLRSSAALKLEFQPVSKRLNSPANDDPALIDPVD